MLTDLGNLIAVDWAFHDLVSLVLVLEVLVGGLVGLELGQSVLFSVLDGVLDVAGDLVVLGNADELNLTLVALVRSVVHGADIVLLLGEADVASNRLDLLVGVGLDLVGGGFQMLLASGLCRVLLGRGGGGLWLVLVSTLLLLLLLMLILLLLVLVLLLLVNGLGIPGLLSVPLVVGLLEVVVIFRASKEFFLLDALFPLLLNVAALSSLALSSVSIAGVHEGSGAQREVLRAAEVSNLLSVKVSAHSTGNVAVLLISVDDDLLGVNEGNIDGGGLDLDSTVWHFADLGNVVVALLALVLLNDGVWGLDGLTVDIDNEGFGLLGLEKSLHSTSSGLWLSNNDLGAGENDLQFDILSS